MNKRMFWDDRVEVEVIAEYGQNAWVLKAGVPCTVNLADLKPIPKFSHVKFTVAGVAYNEQGIFIDGDSAQRLYGKYDCVIRLPDIGDVIESNGERWCIRGVVAYKRTGEWRLEAL